jgi:hypothetical protein
MFMPRLFGPGALAYAKMPQLIDIIRSKTKLHV